MASWALAACHEIGGFFPRPCTFRSTSQMSLGAGLLNGKVVAHPHRLADLAVQALDGIGGVEDFAQLRRKGEARDHLFPVAPPALAIARYFWDLYT
jgi:hypothetical protein